MNEFRHGLFIGKFYPPHLGHHGAIRTATRRCERVTVVVMASVAETIDLSDRVAWLRAEHADSPAVQVVGVRCDAPLDLTDERIWTAQIAVMDAGVRSVSDEPVDAVFSTDHYGRELADRFKAKFVGLERACSATSVRKDLAGNWRSLAPATRAGMTSRVVVLGAESTGTTTVSRELVEHYRRRGGIWADTAWVGEYGRDYTGIKWDAEKSAARAEGRPEPTLHAIGWSREDFDRVADSQTAAEERAARAGSPVLICDTDAFATAIWERRYLGIEARTGQDWSRTPLLPRRELYLLTDHQDVPWFNDGLREGDLAIRTEMTSWFADALTAAGHSWVLLSGTLSERVGLAVRSVDQLLAYRMSFGAPLTGPGFG
jgi:HTH-type transcriptional repressor of NAD biosynthesis genes